MAGDWIPMRCDLADDPAVIMIAGKTGLDEHAVVGRLHRLWSWANTHLKDGNARGVTVAWVDRYLGQPGFGRAMVVADWLKETADGIVFPNFDRWNSQSAKKRALSARRVAIHKLRGNAGDNAQANAPSVSAALPTVQDSTVQSPLPPSGEDAAAKTTARKNPANRRDDDEDPRFKDFWAVYPRKENRKKASEAFAKLAPDETLFGLMMAALEEQRRWPKWTKDNGQYIPHATTWINNHRWKDRPPEVLPPVPVKPVAKTVSSAVLDPELYGPPAGGCR